MLGSILEKGTAVPVFKPPFDVVHQMALEARAAKEKAAPQRETACPIAPVSYTHLRAHET